MISGILLIDKPEGVTSFEVVHRARQALGIRKVGHLGTLDPMATGLLPLCLLEATKLVPYLMPEAKVYRAQGQVGGRDRHPGCLRRGGGPVRDAAGAGADLPGRGGIYGRGDPDPADVLRPALPGRTGLPPGPPGGGGGSAAPDGDDL